MAQSMIESTRLELGVAAMASVRRNRPRWMIWMAAIVFICTAIYAMTGYSTLSSAQSRLDRTRARQATLTGLVQEIMRMKAGEAARGMTRDIQMVPKMERWADQMHVHLSGPIIEGDGPGVPGLARKTYTAKFGNEDPRTVLMWLNAVRVAPDLAGIELTDLSFNTGRTGYTAQATFGRWEKLQ